MAKTKHKTKAAKPRVDGTKRAYLAWQLIHWYRKGDPLATAIVEQRENERRAKGLDPVLTQSDLNDIAGRLIRGEYK
jgi:hypothetical protein